MCLIAIGWQVHPEFPLVLAANRDEFYARPTAFAGRWPNATQVIAGQDLQAGGTWLGITDTGRLAAVTNVREPGALPGRLSRGRLTADFLLGSDTAESAIQRIADDDYSGYNLLLSDGESLCYRTNRHGSAEVLSPGIYGLSNHRLDTPWPKLSAIRAGFAEALDQLPAVDALEAALFDLLADARQAADHELPDTGVSLDWERRLSAIFIASPDYGTRASTVVMQRADGCLRLHEKSFGANGVFLQSSVISTGV